MRLTDPTRGDLKAAAGWALFKQPDVSDAHANALEKFKDGCVALMEHAEETPRGAVSPEAHAPVVLPRVTPPRAMRIPDDAFDVIEALGQRTCRNGGRHSFNRLNTDMTCKWCGRTYLEAKGRMPELIR